MPDLTVRYSVQVPGGPTIQGDRTIPVASFQQMELTLPPNANGTARINVDFTPSDAEGINLLLIQSTLYSSSIDKPLITFAYQDKAADASKDKADDTAKDKATDTAKDSATDDLPLAEPFLLLGSDVIGKIAQPKSLTFKNLYEWTDGKDDTLTKNTAKITVLVGRVPPPPPAKLETSESEESAKTTTPPAPAPAPAPAG